MSAALAAARRHLDLLRNSGSLMATTVVTAALGFVFWWLAARVAAPAAVGAAASAVAAMGFIGTVGAFGLGTLLIAELPRMRTGRAALIRACVLVSGAVAAAGGVGYLVLGRYALPGLHAGSGSAAGAVLLVAGIAVTAMALVFDDALIGLLAGPVQLLRNTCFAAGKLALLAVAAVLPVTVTSGYLLGVWLAGALGSAGVLVLWRRRVATVLGPAGHAGHAGPAGHAGSVVPTSVRLTTSTVEGGLRALRRLRRPVLEHNLLNLSLFLPRQALPLVVTAVLSTAATAAFYTAWMVVALLAMIPAHLATTLYAVTAGDRSALRAKVRVALLVALALGVPASVLVALHGRLVMSVFGAGYAATAGTALSVLALTYVPTVVRHLYVAVSRAQRRVRRATAVALPLGLLEVAAAALGARHGGLTGLAWCLAAVFAAEAVLLAPRVLAAALPPARDASGP